MKNQSGQVLVLLIMILTVALATGLSIIQKSLSDISTASKVEQSSRAFSAAEAGIEKALQGETTGLAFDVNFDNNSAAQVSDLGLQPPTAAVGERQAVLEYGRLSKEDVAQIWLADYNSTANPPPAFYTQTELDVYWGDSATDMAALEVTIIYYNGTEYKTSQLFLDHPSTVGVRDNGFDRSANCPAQGILVGSIKYQCEKRLTLPPGSSPNILIMLRARLLYNKSDQPLAVQAVGTCGQGCSLPSQTRIIYSRGSSGEIQRTVAIIQQNKVVPPYFDYVLFSKSDITK